ncbi:hypothetical protein J6590_001068 [Homalodisca vitripennis]|nr:hypothetical protein J6590_001068 [Homalodisca vitripennis]
MTRSLIALGQNKTSTSWYGHVSDATRSTCKATCCTFCGWSKGVCLFSVAPHVEEKQEFDHNVSPVPAPVLSSHPHSAFPPRALTASPDKQLSVTLEERNVTRAFERDIT